MAGALGALAGLAGASDPKIDAKVPVVSDGLKGLNKSKLQHDVTDAASRVGCDDEVVMCFRSTISPNNIFQS